MKDILEVQKYKFTCHLFRYVLNETAKKDKNKNSGKKADANFNESMAEQKINWIGKLEPNSEEALTMFEALKKDEIANQAQLRLARISGRYICFAFCERLCPSKGGFFSESAMNFLDLQISKKIFQKTILSLKFSFNKIYGP